MTKTEKYKSLISQAVHLIGPKGKYQVDTIGRMAILSALIKRYFDDLVFAGFFLAKKDGLHIGPYQGDVIACTPIAYGSGLCGMVAQTGKTIVVKNIKEYSNYVFCDKKTRSEIVVPVIKGNNLIGILDINASEIGQFDDIDQKYCESLVQKVF